MAIILLFLAGAAPVYADTPTVDGLLYGTGDYHNYPYHIDASIGGVHQGILWWDLDPNTNTLYVAVEVDTAINDCVFGDTGQSDNGYGDAGYLQSAGWGTTEHTLKDLYGSDCVGLSLACGDTVWYDWRQDLLYGSYETGWASDPSGPDGLGTPPPGLASASSLARNLNYSLWDVCTSPDPDRANAQNSGKSCDLDHDGSVLDGEGDTVPEGYPRYAAVYEVLWWEWPIIYEMSFPLPTGCTTSSWELDVYYAHNSPSKGGEEETVDFPTVAVTLSYFQATRDGDLTTFDWSTATETGNLGYFLYVEQDGERVPVNDEIVLSQAVDSLTPLDYRYQAAGLTGELFWIEDLDLWGQRQQSGPFELGRAYGARFSPEPIDWEAIEAARAAEAQWALPREEVEGAPASRAPRRAYR
ncbi:MAG: hypothetical protein JXA74_17550 [Anaerolineae bacterium]|nr:hypothetical protein [Anaerolineae bacterium]